MTVSRSIALDAESRGVRPADTNAQSSEDARLAGYTWYVVGLLTVTSVFSYVDRMAMAALAPLVQQELGLSDSQLGMLTGLAFSLFYAVCGLPLARWADSGTRRNVLAGALTTWSVMTALSGVAQNFWHMFFARVGIGAGEAGCLPAAQSIICDYVPVRRRAGIFAIHNVGNYMGMMLGLILAGWLGQMLGWRLTFVALGLPGIALALILRFTLSEPTRGAFDAVRVGNEPRPSLIEIFATLKGCRTYRFLLSFYVLNGFVQYGLIQWWPSFYSRTSDLDLASIGLYLGLAVGGGATAGSLAGGWIASRLAHRNAGQPLAISALITLLAIPAVLASLFTSSIHMSIGFVALSALSWSVSNGPVIATATSVVSPTMRATSSSIIIFATALLGFGLGPLCVGALSDLLTPTFGKDALRYAFLVPICLLPAMSYVLHEASKTASVDLRGQT